MGDNDQRLADQRAPIRLAASYTAGSITDIVRRCGHQLGWSAELIETPYGRLAIHLADGQGLFWQDASLRVMLLRPEDLGGSAVGTARIISDAITQHHDHAPLLIILGSHDQGAERLAVRELEDALPQIDQVFIRSVTDQMSAYGVEDSRDELADRSGHIPYTEEGMAVLGLAIARQADAILRPPVKMIAVDADNTLWKGVLGEDGPGGLVLTEGQDALQTQLKAASQSGIILALLTKNDAADIRAVFDLRQDFPLDIRDFLSIRAGWDNKTDSLTALLSDLGIGANAVLFLDDNPVECAQMKAHLPEVLTIQLQEEGVDTAFLHHLWPMDRQETTQDDLKRLERYRQEEVRAGARHAAPDLEAFFATLDLKIELFEPRGEDISRLAQLSQRTNQFNTTLLRLQDTEITSRITSSDGFVRGIRVKDRFGDYGSVGLLYGQIKKGELRLDVWSLSCRVLGRGVEHEILARLCAEAGINAVLIQHITGPRNEPARRFLAGVAGENLPAEGWLTLDLAALEGVHFTPKDEVEEGSADQESLVLTNISRGDAYQHIATTCRRKENLSQLFVEARKRPLLENAYIPPRDELESMLAALWRDILNIEQIGREDDFHALGGRSLDLVRIHTRLIKADVAELSLADLFRFPTIASLADFLRGGVKDTGDRASAMRAARSRRVRRTS